MNKPSKKTVKQFHDLCEQITKLNELKSTLIKKMIAKYGEIELHHEYDKPDKDGWKWMRYRLVDNTKKMDEEERVLVLAYANKYVAEKKELKNGPKE